MRLGRVGSRSRAITDGRLRGDALVRRCGAEVRNARLVAGLSQRHVGHAVGVSHTQIGRIERGELGSLGIAFAAQLGAVLGLQLTLAMFPRGSPIRDAAHLALLERLRIRLHPSLAWRTEVPMPIPRDLRAADAIIGRRPWTALVEAETRLHDEQATERRARLKQRDCGADRLILLLLESRANRATLRTSPAILARFPIAARVALARLGRAEDPGGDVLLLL